MLVHSGYFRQVTYRKTMSRREIIPPGTWQNPAETGLYYLQSRYYDPTVGRFLNADGIIGANGGIDVKYDGICLNIYVEKEFYERIDEFDVFESGIQINDVIFDVLPIEKDTDDKCLIQYIERSKAPLIKFAIAFASEPLSGDINISVIED